MPVVDTLVTRYVLDHQNYKQGAASVTKSTGMMASGMQSLGANILPMLGTAIAAAGAGLAAFAYKASQTAMDFEAQTKALSLYETAGWKTADMLKHLREVAKLPGLGNLEAMQGAVRLMASGFDFTATIRALRAFGNAIAAAGGGKEDLQGVILQLGQMASRGKVMNEEISVMAERVPQIRRALLDAFGTAVPEEISKMGYSASEAIMMIIASLEKLPQATSTAKNEISNLGDAYTYAMAQIGAATNQQAMPAISQLSAFIEHLSTSGVFTQLGADLANLFSLGGSGGGVSPIVRVMAYAIAWGEQMVMAVAGIKDAILGTIRTVGGAMAGFLDALPFDIGKGWAKNLRNIAMPGFGVGLLGGITDLGARVSERAESLLTGFGTRKQKPYQAPPGGTIASGGSSTPSPATPDPAMSELEKQTFYLGSIERNTSPQRNTILGGGNLGAQGISATDLSRIKGGRRKVDQLARLLQEMMSEEAANQSSQFIRMASPFVSGR